MQWVDGFECIPVNASWEQYIFHMTSYFSSKKIKILIIIIILHVRRERRFFELYSYKDVLNLKNLNNAWFHFQTQYTEHENMTLNVL